MELYRQLTRAPRRPYPACKSCPRKQGAVQSTAAASRGDARREVGPPGECLNPQSYGTGDAPGSSWYARILSGAEVCACACHE